MNRFQYVHPSGQCRHLHTHTRFVTRRIPGTIYGCEDCGDAWFIPQYVERVEVEKPVYVDREVRVYEAGLAEWVLFAALVIGFIVLVVTM